MTSLLVVDDEPRVSRVTKLCLERAGYDVEVAFDGAEALEKLVARPFDALITDLVMPRMTGRELCERIEETLRDRKFPIFVVTSSPEEEHREWAARMERVEFFEKPLSLRHLIARLEHHLGPNSPRGEGGA